MTNPRTKQYDQYKDVPIEELAQSICGGYAAGSEHELKKLIYEQKTIERQFEHQKEQIELQHKRNTELVKEQVKWIKYSALITALATIAAALLGWYLGRESQQLKEQLRLKTELLQQIELRTKNTTSGTHPEQKPDKVPLSPPK